MNIKRELKTFALPQTRSLTYITANQQPRSVADVAIQRNCPNNSFSSPVFRIEHANAPSWLPSRVKRTFGRRKRDRDIVMLKRVAFLQRGVAGMAGSAQESVQQQKKALRAVVKRKLRNFPLRLREEEDDAIQAHVLSSDWFRHSNNLCAYLSCAALREVDTSQIVTQILQLSDTERAKELYVPRVVDREANMSMLSVSTVSDLIVNSMGIVEPDFNYPDGNPRKNVMDAETPVDLVLMPGLAFDRTGRRLGRGGGYYDVFLQRYLQLAKSKGWKPPLLVALAYSEQVMEDPVPVDSTDIPVDALILSTGVLPISEYGVKNLSKSASPVSDSV